MSNQPLTWLLTLPLHLLPGGWIPLALNLFSAFTATLILGVLARSIDLLTKLFPSLTKNSPRLLDGCLKKLNSNGKTFVIYENIYCAQMNFE
ncbi:MAG TPA: hypothetical protein VIK53_03795 [Verrucomicrobiae bacterium]